MSNYTIKPSKKAVLTGILIAMLLGNVVPLSLHSQSPPAEQLMERNEAEEIIALENEEKYCENRNIDYSDNIFPRKGVTRANNPYLSNHIHPINARDNEGGNPDYLNLDEDAPGDNNKEISGKDTTYAWIECGYSSANIPVGSTINNMTIYIGYNCDTNWDITAEHKGIVWSSSSGGTEHNISDYTVSVADRDEIYTVTSDLPTASELNGGIYIRISGYDTDGSAGDYIHLDYLYFTINYSIPDIVINEIMFNATGSDDNAEWVELYNAGDAAVNLTGWNLTDNDGNNFILSPAGSIPPGGYLVCHLAQPGINSSTDIYGAIEYELVLQPNATEGKDNYLEELVPDVNRGSSINMIAEYVTENRRPIIRFNLSNLPVGNIEDAEVFLYRHDGNGANDATVNVHRVNQSWTETGADWNTYDGTNAWSTAGGDYAPSIEDTQVILAGTNGWYSWDITNLTKNWKNGTYQNYGMIFVCDADSQWQSFYSSDYTIDISLRPKLVVKYCNTIATMLEDNDDIALVDGNGNIIDYVAWGADPGIDDDGVPAYQWVDGDYIDTSQLSEGQTLGRDKNSNDTDQPQDWENATGYADHFGVDRTPIFGPSPGARNVDPDLKGPAVTDVYADPDTQALGGYINITCNATDPDGVYGVWLNITSPGGGYVNASMIQGAVNQWYYNDTYAKLGLYRYTIWANDLFGNWTKSSVLQFNVLNRIPTISSGQVNPTIGYTDTWFNFTVNYTDLDNHAPDIITVNITNLGVYPLGDADSSDTDYTDGKLLYINISAIPVGSSYSFHFAANDTIGDWALEPPEIDAPDVLPRSATLIAFDETVEYSDNAFLNATLIENSNPIAGEDVAFYIDIDDNGIYEEWELAGAGTTFGDGSVSVTYAAYHAPDTYDFNAVYIGSANYVVDDDEALLIINAKQASLTAINGVAEKGQTTSINAAIEDNDGDPIAYEQVAFYLDKNRNGIYEGSEFIGLSTTSANGIASITYSVNLAPESYGIWAKYVGSGNYIVNEIEGLLNVQNTGNNPPSILDIVPNQIKPEDCLPWTLDLTPYEADFEDSGSHLKWYLAGIDQTLYSVTGMNSSDDVFTFIPVENAFGNDEVILWLADSNGAKVSQALWINITPVNDPPYFNPKPPNLFVHYDNPSIGEDDPNLWDYTFYAHDVETSVDNLVITTSEPTVDSGYGFAEVDGLKVTFHYPQSRVGDSILVTLTLSDDTNTTQTTILVNVTSDWVPELVGNLPDVVLEENSTLYNVFDLDDYFTDRDYDSLFFSSSYFHIQIDINEDNTVNITALGQWTGSELVTFRAKDPTGAMVEEVITVTVIPVNNPPVISGVPDLVVHFDYSYAFDLSPYISDPDNLTSELKIWTSESSDNVWLQQYNNLGIIVNYPESMDGMTIPLTIYVSDGIEIATRQIIIAVTSDFPPELIFKLPDVSFDEDSVLENAFLLSNYFIDIDGEALYYTSETNFITVTINEDIGVGFSAPGNWYGFEIVKFRAKDPSGAIVEDKILVVVVPVNDPPEIESIPKQEKNEGEQWTLDLSRYIDDVDNDASELIIDVESEVGQGYVTLVGNTLIFQYPEGVYDDVVTVTVSDGELETSRSFIVSIKSSSSVVPTIWDIIPWPWIFFLTLSALGGAFAFYRKRSSYWVYEAFLIHEKGLPIAHASQEGSSELENVVVSGMFTAVQDFIGDAFSGETFDDWELDEMKFGDNKILTEKSQNLYLAAIFEGNGDKLRKRVKKVMLNINEEYGEVLEHWDGDMTKLRGIKAMIAGLVPKKADEHLGPEHSPAQTQLDEGADESNGELTGSGDTREAVGEGSEKPLKSVDETQPRDVKAEEVEVYECPICGEEIRPEDTKCPLCGVEFEEAEDQLSPSSQKLGEKGSKES